jgi:hypothetical protein
MVHLRVRYIEGFIAQWERMVKEADQVAGLKVNSQLLWQDESGDYNIKT